MILLDTNILLRMADAGHPHHGQARKAVRTLKSRRERLIIVPQNLYEFWAAGTRSIGNSPQSNGLGLAPERADFWLAYWQRTFGLLVDHIDLHVQWRALVHSHGIRGSKSHDARLVAAMKCHGIARLLTFNGPDFKTFSNITILDPDTV